MKLVLRRYILIEWNMLLGQLVHDTDLRPVWEAGAKYLGFAVKDGGVLRHQMQGVEVSHDLDVPWMLETFNRGDPMC